MVKVKLESLVDAMDCQCDEANYYLDKTTGIIELISDEDISFAENEEQHISEPPEWQKEQIEVAKKFLENEENYIEIPSKYEINEYSIMEEYIEKVPNEKIQEDLYDAIRGKKAFRKFKDTVYYYKILDDWYKFREERFKSIAIEWCEDNNFEIDFT